LNPQTTSGEPRATNDERRTASNRLFFAFWPDPKTRKKLHAVGQRAKLAAARPIPAQNLHMTLVFLGNAADRQKELLLEKAAEIPGRALALEIDVSGVWKKPQLFWLAPSRPSPDLAALQSRLAALAGDCGFPVDRRVYRPHITLARKVKKAVQPEFAPIQWHIREFCLLASITRKEGAEYQIIRCWPLT